MAITDESYMPLKKTEYIDTFPLQDDLVWKEMKAGNKNAFIQLYNKYADDLLKYGYQLVKNKSLVEDAIHDVFVGIWENKEKKVDVYAIKQYLFTALRRTLLRLVSKEKKWDFIDAFDEKFVTSPFLDKYIQSKDELEKNQRVKNVLESLSQRQKEILYLKFYQNLSYQEISELLRIDQKYTYNLAARALSSFKEQFGQLHLDA